MPEHTSDSVLTLMRKPPFRQFQEFKRIFDRINKEGNLRQQIIPYFISSHPGCHEADMAELAVLTKQLDFHLEQVQDFTPTPMTVSTETWYTGFHPYTMQPVFSAKTQREKLAQRQFFFWYKPEERRNIEQALRRIGRTDLIKQLCSQPANSYNPNFSNADNRARHNAKEQQKKAEDGIVVTDNFIAVIDGSTSKSDKRHSLWRSNGRQCMTLVAKYIKKMPKHITAQESLRGVTLFIAKQYKKADLPLLAQHPEHRIGGKLHCIQQAAAADMDGRRLPMPSGRRAVRQP